MRVSSASRPSRRSFLSLVPSESLMDLPSLGDTGDEYLGVT